MKSISNKTTAMKRIETKRGKDIEEVLRALFVDEQLSQIEIAKQLNLSYVTVIKWLKLAGVYSRKLNVH